MSLDECRIIDLPQIIDARGSLTYIEGMSHVPFKIERIFYIYEVPDGTNRGGHALKRCHQFLIAISGSFDVILGDGLKKRCFRLERPCYGLYVPPMVWRDLCNYSHQSVCLVLASELYSADDYCRDYSEYINMSKKP